MSDPESGIPLMLAAERAKQISDVRYDLTFDIPPEASRPVSARVVIRFWLNDASTPVVLDFEPGENFIVSVSKMFRAVNGHIVISGEQLAAGANEVEIVFRAGDEPLNRNPEFLYTLFVPSRAHFAFPCFDQPDLKARYSLELRIPADWLAVANGEEVEREVLGDRARIRYAETPPISTYLFAFAAGRFQVETAEIDGRSYRMLHRETDAGKVARNRETVFGLHASSLDWLESYTSIPYPFSKLDFILIPSFQFSGMEHPGAIFYDASSILLEESATENQLLGRASLIAHETSHMWFGDLVTMQWFNDVWMKEVFANFMAAKIVDPAFPTVDHGLRFLTAHYPAAYAVDRTTGTHAIRQELANLTEAGGLYGPIIYRKAPIVMRQLERMLGPVRFQLGLRAYLQRFQFGNATWIDLIQVLDGFTLDLAAWSRAWVEGSGRPSIRTEIEFDRQDRIRRLALIQSGPGPEHGLAWMQQTDVLLGTPESARSFSVELRNGRSEVPEAVSLPRPAFVLPSGGGLAYGNITLDQASRRYLVQHVRELREPVTRGAVWVVLWEEMLDGRLARSEFVDAALRALPQEDTEQNIQLVLGYLEQAFWRFLSGPERADLAPVLEHVLRNEIHTALGSTVKATYFSAYRSVVTTAEGAGFLERVWRRQEDIPGLTLAENDEAAMALELAVRSVPNAADILEEQLRRFENTDRKARFEFVLPALSDRQEIRDAFFQSLADLSNRRREPWVLEGVRYLNHPLRSAQSEKYLRPALELLTEIQRTGDIFFPKNWMDATLSGHSSSAAAETVRDFLDEHHDLPARLRQVVLQSADNLFRAVNYAN